jgi:biopolymer transport protein ExbB
LGRSACITSEKGKLMWAEFIDAVTVYLVKGGFVAPPLAVGALVMWYALGYRAVMLRRGSKLPVPTLIEEFRRDPQRQPTTLLERAVWLGLKAKSATGAPLRRRLDEALGELEADVQRYDNLAMSVVSVAPLAGLLGTVAGMIETFDGLGSMALHSQSGGVAGGISQALFSTQLGLAVAVPGLLAGRLLRRKQKRVEDEMRRIKDILSSHVDTRAAA